MGSGALNAGAGRDIGAALESARLALSPDFCYFEITCKPTFSWASYRSLSVHLCGDVSFSSGVIARLP